MKKETFDWISKKNKNFSFTCWDEPENNNWRSTSNYDGVKWHEQYEQCHLDVIFVGLNPSQELPDGKFRNLHSGKMDHKFRYLCHGLKKFTGAFFLDIDETIEKDSNKVTPDSENFADMITGVLEYCKENDPDIVPSKMIFIALGKKTYKALTKVDFKEISGGDKIVIKRLTHYAARRNWEQHKKEFNECHEALSGESLSMPGLEKKTEEITEEKLSAAIQKYMKNAEAVPGIINKDGNILFSYPASFNGKIRFKRGTGKVDIYWEKTDRKPGFIDDFNAKFHTTYKLTPTKNGFDVEKNPSESDAKLCVKLLDQLKKDFA